MIRAILAGTKTQTRRAIKPQPSGQLFHTAAWEWRRGSLSDEPTIIRCPYGIPGERLWVRESHWFFNDERDPITGYFPPKPSVEDVIFRADGEVAGKVWRPSIHMPRWASRILLEVTEVRVHRLQDISEVDALAEGVDMQLPVEMPFAPGMEFCTVTMKPRTAREAYSHLWDSINGPGSSGANPWVWAVSFRRIEQRSPQ